MSEIIQTPPGTENENPDSTKTGQPHEPTEVEKLRQENEELKKKFGASTTENQNLQARLQVEENARRELTKEPTDSELRTAFPSWDLYDDTQKDFARRTFAAERTAQNAAQIAHQLKEKDAWNTSLELAIQSNPALQGKEQTFREYASKPQYRNIPTDVLVNSFLNISGAAAPAEPRTTPKPGLEPGNGGPRITETKPNLLTPEQLQALRKTDERQYKEYIMKHPEALEI